MCPPLTVVLIILSLSRTDPVIRLSRWRVTKVSVPWATWGSKFVVSSRGPCVRPPTWAAHLCASSRSARTYSAASSPAALLDRRPH